MELENTDRGVLSHLQQGARRITTQEVTETVGVSASTVRDRTERPEASGAIRGCHPDDEAGLQLPVEITCSGPTPRRARLATVADEVAGVVATREVLNGSENVRIDAAGTDSDDIARITDPLSDTGLRSSTRSSSRTPTAGRSPASGSTPGVRRVE